MKSNVRRRVASGATAIALAAGLLASAPTPAQAAYYGYVYVSLPTWLGNCGTSGGEVKGVYGATGDYGQLWSTPHTGDLGDDIVYARVLVGASNTFIFKPYCSRPWYKGGSYWGATSEMRTYVSRANQTVWTGPWGIRTN